MKIRNESIFLSKNKERKVFTTLLPEKRVRMVILTENGGQTGGTHLEVTFPLRPQSKVVLESLIGQSSRDCYKSSSQFMSFHLLSLHTLPYQVLSITPRTKCFESNV